MSESEIEAAQAAAERQERERLADIAIDELKQILHDRLIPFAENINRLNGMEVTDEYLNFRRLYADKLNEVEDELRVRVAEIRAEHGL